MRSLLTVDFCPVTVRLASERSEHPATLPPEAAVRIVKTAGRDGV
ncbi:MAG: hypothetical protein FD127_3068 [Acidimicrobiaceae bacterium]|nr:MAG: hypothetical protein FD127_3068 [Acidimicrobiaceae bacterium]